MTVAILITIRFWIKYSLYWWGDPVKNSFQHETKSKSSDDTFFLVTPYSPSEDESLIFMQNSNEIAKSYFTDYKYGL